MSPEEYIEYMVILLKLMQERFLLTEKQAETFRQAILEKLAKNKGQVTEDMMRLTAKDLGIEADIEFDISQASPYFRDIVTRRYQLVKKGQEEQRRKQEESEYERKAYEYRYGGGEYGKRLEEREQERREQELDRQQRAAAAQKWVEEMQARKWFLSDVEDVEGRRRLAQAVAEGRIPQEQAYGKGSPWEAWQHGMAEREMIGGAARRQQQISELVNKIQSWASQGFNQATTPEEVGAIEAQAREALAANEGLFSRMGEAYGEQHLSLAFQGTQAMQNVLRMQGQLLQSEYPKWWQEYTQKTLAPTREAGVYISPPAEQAGFADWTTRQPKFKEEQRAKETEWYTQYPQLYPAYQKAPIQERMGGFLPWIEKTPWAKAYQNLQTQGRGAIRTPKWATARQFA